MAAAPDQFNTPHGIAVDGDGNVYVADRGNNRIQVYDYDLNFKKTITGIGAPWSVQVTPKYHLQRRRHRQDLPARPRRQAAGLGADRPGPGPDRLPDPRAARRVRHTSLRGACSEWNVEKITFGIRICRYSEEPNRDHGPFSWRSPVAHFDCRLLARGFAVRLTEQQRSETVRQNAASGNQGERHDISPGYLACANSSKPSQTFAMIHKRLS